MANWKDLFKSVHPMPAGDKGPVETRCLLRGAGLRQTWSSRLPLRGNLSPGPKSDLETPSQGPTNLQVCTAECVRGASLEYAPHTVVWTLEESSRSSVQAIHGATLQGSKSGGMNEQSTFHLHQPGMLLY